MGRKKKYPHNIPLLDKPAINLWMTRADPEFNSEMFLYHYTNFESACKILYSESLKFSSLSKTNDTVEAKPKIRATHKNEQHQLSLLLNHFQSMNKDSIQLMCFSKDAPLKRNYDTLSTVFDDFTGRGFALPRMWAQYAENNEGVCFIINKNELLNLIMKSPKYRSQIIRHDKVDYNSIFDAYKMSSEEIKVLDDYFSQDNPILDYSFLKDNEEFITNNYFKKSNDWSQENEYRILAFSPSPIYIQKLGSFLSGLVIGEKMEPVQAKIIFDLAKGVCREIKQIQFDYSECTLKNLNFKGYDIFA